MGISIQIVAGPDKTSSSVIATGSIQHVITDEERVAFGLTDQQLKDAVSRYFGKAPDSAYLHSPTPWNDLYKSYGWDEVQVILVADSAEILSLDMQPTILKKQDLVNNSSKAGTFHADVSESVTDNISTNWSSVQTLSVGQQFTYGVSFLGAGGQGQTSLSFSQAWGQGGEQSTSVQVGSSSGVDVPLGPGESVTAELVSSRGTLKIRIRYRAYLVGGTAVNYDPTYNGHHFWWFPIDAVMNAAGISNALITEQDIEVGYYTNSRVETKDSTTGMLKLTAAAVGR